MSLILPSYQSGFAPRDYEPAYPSLWQGCVAAYAPLLGPSGLVLRDSVGKNDGVLTGGPTWDISGGRYAIGFDGTDDYVVLGALKNLGTAYTVSGFVKTDIISGNGIIASYRSTTTGTPILFQFDRNNADYRLTVRDDSSILAQAVAASYAIVSEWAHVCGVRDGSTLRIYVNGIERGSASNSLNAITVDSLNIGATVSGGTNRSAFFDGHLDDIRIYNRALSDNEIRLLASRRGIGYDYKTHRSYSKTQSSGLLKRLILTGQT